MVRTLHALMTAVAFTALSACTVHKQADAPPLTGPSTSATQVNVTVLPDILTQDGASQSLVTIAAFGPYGQPLPNLSMRVEIVVDGAVTDFGRLSARNLVTDAAGKATVTYTAPPPPAIIVDNGTLVAIQVTPLDGDAANSNPRLATIRLVPPGVIPAPVSPLRPSFTVPALNVGDNGIFNAVVVDSTGANAITQVASFQWNFGDGGTASGQSVTHTYFRIGTFPITLTIIDSLGRTNFITQSITVGQGQLPTATFVASPATPVVNQTINFNATGSTAAPGHNIVTYDWNFGDGSFGGGSIVTHSYSQTGTYTVTLQVTDDAGRRSSLATQSISVGNGNPTVDFTFNPSAPKGGQQVTFDASATQAAPGRTIVSFSWSFGDGGAGTGQTVVHTYAAVLVPTTFNVLLTVTDSAGKTASATKPITINP